MERGKNEREKENAYEQKAAFKVFYDFFSSYKVRACGIESVTGRCFQTRTHPPLLYDVTKCGCWGRREESKIQGDAADGHESGGIISLNCN